MVGYAILIDGARVARVNTEDDLRTWIATYQKDHSEDDPAAVHIQILERGTFAWLTGGKLVPREDFIPGSSRQG